jgi:uncharacterized damage-inducible protein DinB
MIAKELLAQHLEYSLWASMQVFEAAAKLSPEELALDRQNSFGGILDTLEHIFRADRIWLKRFLGEPQAIFHPAGETLGMDALRQQWPAIGADFAAWVRAQDDSRLEEKLYWRNIRGEDKEEKIYKILLHVVNHGSYHRGQVITMIKQAGGEVPSTDLVYYPGM